MAPEMVWTLVKRKTPIPLLGIKPQLSSHCTDLITLCLGY